jgi:YVTN family beta-propeller protein
MARVMVTVVFILGCTGPPAAVMPPARDQQSAVPGSLRGPASLVRTDSRAAQFGGGPYAANYIADTILIIDRPRNLVVATIPVEQQPFLVAADRDGSRIYLVNRADDVISVIDTTTNLVMATVLVGRVPMPAVTATDGTLLYVGCFYPDTLTVVDVTTQTVVADIAVPNLVGELVVHPSGTRTYAVSLQGEGPTARPALSVVDLVEQRITAVIPVGVPGITANTRTSAAINPSGTRVYLADPAIDSITVVDTTTDQVVAVVPTGRGPDKMTLTPDGALLYVANAVSSSVSIIETVGNTVLTTVPVGRAASSEAIAGAPGDLTTLGSTPGEREADERASAAGERTDARQLGARLQHLNAAHQPPSASPTSGPAR